MIGVVIEVAVAEEEGVEEEGGEGLERLVAVVMDRRLTRKKLRNGIYDK